MIEAAALSYDRLPVMEVVFERFALAAAPALKLYTAASVDVILETLDYTSCGEALDAIGAPGFVMVAETTDKHEQIVLALDAALLFHNLEVMLGGGKTAPAPREVRNFTMIEKRLGTRFCEVALQSLTDAASQLCPLRFRPSSVENNPRNAMIAPAAAPCMTIRFRVVLGGREGHMTFVIPNTVIESYPALLAQTIVTGRASEAQAWRSTMQANLTDTEVEIVAVLASPRLTLAEILALEPGSLIPLGIDAEGQATLYCSNRSVFHGHVGRNRLGQIAIRMDSDVVQIPDPLARLAGGAS